jgi:hypothetical protein
MANVVIRVLNDLPVPLRVQGVAVAFYTTGGLFETSGTTDVNGEVLVFLPDAGYDVVFYKRGVSILPKQPQRITVDSLLTNTFEVTGHETVMPESLDATRCRVSGFILGSDGKPVKGTRLVFTPKKEIIVIGINTIAPDNEVTAVSDDTGYVEFDLLRNLLYDGYFVDKDSILGIHPGTLDIVVPNSPSTRLDTLLFPLPVNVDFSANSISLALFPDVVDDSIDATITYSDGSIRTSPSVWGTYKVVVSDTTIVEAAINGPKLLLKTLAVGTATVTVERLINDQAFWSVLPAFTSEEVVVTVT